MIRCLLLSAFSTITFPIYQNKIFHIKKIIKIWFKGKMNYLLLIGRECCTFSQPAPYTVKSITLCTAKSALHTIAKDTKEKRTHSTKKKKKVGPWKCAKRIVKVREKNQIWSCTLCRQERRERLNLQFVLR